MLQRSATFVAVISLLPALHCLSRPVHGAGHHIAALRPGLTATSLKMDLVPPPPSPAAAMAEWTIMVYMNAKNDLEGFGLKDLNEMEAVGSSEKVNVVAEMGRMKGYDAGDGDWTGVRRYHVTKDGDPARVSSPVIEDLGARDMGDWRELAAFGAWARANYPARRYMLIVWNHGTGWLKDRGGDKGISYDDETGSHMDTPQLAAALKAMGKVDIYASDACLMQMAEVAYELKDYAGYIVGSEETEPADGYPYDALLAAVSSKPMMAADELARKTVDAYADYYQRGETGFAISAVRASAMTELRQRADDILKALMDAGEKDLARNAAREAQKFAIKDNRDLLHFTRLVSSGTKSPGVKEKCAALMEFIKAGVVSHNRNYTALVDGWWPGPLTYFDAHGIAVYLPSAAAGEGYGELRWAKDSLWDEFIAWYQAP